MWSLGVPFGMMMVVCAFSLTTLAPLQRAQNLHKEMMTAERRRCCWGLVRKVALLQGAGHYSSVFFPVPSHAWHV